MIVRTPEEYAANFVRLMWKELGFAYHDELLEPLTAAFEDAMNSSHVATMNRAVERAADVCEKWAKNYPSDVFPAESDSRDAIAGAALRVMLPRVAQCIRERLLPDLEEGR